MRMRWKSTIAIACVLVVCVASLLLWQFRRRPVERLNALRARATQGNPKAQFGLASAYYLGKGVPQDYAEALRWFKMAADQGEPRAEDALGYMYFSGKGAPQDYAQALEWYKRSAGQGNAKGQFDLATMYYNGHGVPQDYAEADHWFRKAADGGYAEAQDYLGNMYYYGSGVPQDRAEAERWYHKAADQGDEYAQHAIRLKGTGLSILGIVTRAGIFFWCLWVLKDAVWPLRNLRLQHRPALATAAILGVTWVVLSLYQAFGTFYSLLTVTAFYFVEGLVEGATIGILIAVFGPKSIKIVLAISGVLLAANDLIVISHHQLMRFITTIPHFGSVNGLLMGVAVPLAIVLWLEAGKTEQKTNGSPGSHFSPL